MPQSMSRAIQREGYRLVSLRATKDENALRSDDVINLVASALVHCWRCGWEVICQHEVPEEV
jgi:hypothetical protein